MSNEIGGKLQFIGNVEETSASESENVATTVKTTFSIKQRCNLRYLKSRNGILKLTEMTIGVLCMACLPTNRNVSSNSILMAFAATFFALNLIWYIIYAFSSWSFAENFPIKFMDYAYSCLASFCYLVTSITHFILNNIEVDKKILEFPGYYTSYSIAGAFGIINTVVYGMDCFFVYRGRDTLTYGMTINNV